MRLLNREWHRSVIKLPERSKIWDSFYQTCNPNTDIPSPTFEDLFDGPLTPLPEDIPRAHYCLEDKVPLIITTLVLEELTIKSLKKMKCPVDKNMLTNRASWTKKERKHVSKDIKKWSADDPDKLTELVKILL